MSGNKRFTLRNQQEELDDFTDEDIIDFRFSRKSL